MQMLHKALKHFIQTNEVSTNGSRNVHHVSDSTQLHMFGGVVSRCQPWHLQKIQHPVPEFNVQEVS
jgi:hypothetical protein